MAEFMFSSTPHDEGSIFFQMTEAESETATPTNGLRFVEGRLQQAFNLERWKGLIRLEQSIEWRDVPSVDLADANLKKD